MTSKKDYILKALQTLQPYWPIVEDLIKLVDHDVFTPEMINSIQQIISKTISWLVDGTKKEKLQEAFAELERIKAMEATARIEEQKELSDLEDQIADS